MQINQHILADLIVVGSVFRFVQRDAEEITLFLITNVAMGEG